MGEDPSGFLINREVVKEDFGALFSIKSVEVLILNLDNGIMQLQILALNPTADEPTVKDLNCQQTGLMVKNARHVGLRPWTFQT